jgi:hypothetical protein
MASGTIGIGPESIFHHADIFLCKAAGGGKDITVGFRPPSSSASYYNGTGISLSSVYYDRKPDAYSVYYKKVLRIFRGCMNELDEWTKVER